MKMTPVDRITIRNIQKPRYGDFRTDTFWLCNTLGLSPGRDTENLATEIILSILEETGNKRPITSDHLASLLDISVGRVNHHLRNLHRSGVIYREKKIIHMRGITLLDSIKEMRKDINRIFDELEDVASEIDNHLGIHGRIEEKQHHALAIPFAGTAPFNR